MRPCQRQSPGFSGPIIGTLPRGPSHGPAEAASAGSNLACASADGELGCMAPKGLTKVQRGWPKGQRGWARGGIHLPWFVLPISSNKMFNFK